MPVRRDEAAIFNVARRMESADARRVYLQVACGADVGLRQRIDALLRVHDEDQSFLTLPTLVKLVRNDLGHVVSESSAAAGPTLDPAPAPAPKGWLNRFLRKICGRPR
jgi:hypothetical protein